MWEELKRPATMIGIAVGVIGIVTGIVTSVYFYIKAQARPEIALNIEQVQVFDKNRTGPMPLTVRDEAGQVIDNNVLAANVTIWNSGNAPIKHDDVRQPFRLTTGQPNRIIDITPTYFTRDNVDQFSVDHDGHIDWKYFDPGEGFKVRLIYASPSMQSIGVSGYALGTTIIDIGQNTQSNKKLANNLILGVTVLALIGFTGTAILNRRRSQIKET